MDWLALTCGLAILCAGYGVLFALAMWLRQAQYRHEIRERLFREVQNVGSVQTPARLGSGLDARHEFNFADVSESEV